MGIRNKLAQYKAYKSGVQHCTFDPEQHGVVRMHLVPPVFRLFGNPAYIVILNGYYLLPVGTYVSMQIIYAADAPAAAKRIRCREK